MSPGDGQTFLQQWTELIEAQKWDGECVQKERVDVFVGVCVRV